MRFTLPKLFFVVTLAALAVRRPDIANASFWVELIFSVAGITVSGDRSAGGRSEAAAAKFVVSVRALLAAGICS